MTDETVSTPRARLTKATSTLRARLSTLIGRERERAWGRLFAVVVWFLLVTALWVIGLTLLFLATGWPWWAFYAAVIVGAVGIVQLVGSPTTARPA